MARASRFEMRRGWPAVVVLLLILPTLLFSSTDARFTASTVESLNLQSAQLDDHLPTSATASRTGQTTCEVDWVSAAGTPAGTTYEVINDGGVVVGGPVPSPPVTVAAAAAATPLRVRLRSGSWVSTQTVAAAGCVAALGAPTAVQAVGEDGSAYVAWAAPENTGGHPIISYTAIANPGNHTCTTSTTDCSITGLTNGSSYTVTVRATTENGSGPDSAPAEVTPHKGGTLAGFGFDDAGAMALGEPTSYRPAQVGSQRDWTTVTAGPSNSCAIHTDGTLWCWGRGEDAAQPVLVGVDTYVQLDSSDHRCAVAADGTLTCWGANASGQVGDGTTNEAFFPRTVPGTGWTAVTTGGDHTCGMRSDQTLWCWGDNEHGQLGTGTGPDALSPQQVPGLWKAVTAGPDSTCAVRTAGELWCWGSNDKGQLGDGSTVNSAVPVQVGTDATWTQVDAGGSWDGLAHACGLRQDGSLWCWGSNDKGQLGDGTTASTSIPQAVSGAATWASVSLGGQHSCATRSDSTLWCWGLNNRGQLGIGNAWEQHDPAPVGGTQWRQVSTGDEHTCATRTDDALLCWGTNEHGALGRSSAHLTPRTAAGTTWVDADTTGHTCLVAAGGGLWCGGINSYGQLGDGTQQAASSPVNILPGSRWRAVTTGEFHSCGVQGNSSLWCWGTNHGGVLLGTGDWQDWFEPRQIGTGYATVAAGPGHTCAVRTNGTLWCWGQNSSGQLGVPGLADSVTPVQVGTAAHWRSVSAGVDHTCATTTSDDLYCWGANGEGQAGVAPSAIADEPAQVGAGTAWSATVATGWWHTCATTTTGTLKCWGKGDLGQLGNGAATSSSDPVTVPGTWRDVGVGGEHTCAVNSTNQVWCWGRGDAGQLGSGTTNTPIPRQVPGVRGERVVTGHSTTLLIRGRNLLPSLPTVVQVSPGAGSATLTWSAPTNDGGSPVTGYTARAWLADSPDTESSTAAGVRTCTTTGTGCTITGMDPGSTYSVEVTATNSTGTGAASPWLRVIPQ